MIALLLSSLIGTAQAVPQKLTHQGRLLDSSGAGLSGVHDLTFIIYDSPVGGNILWYEDAAASFTDGYYSIVLGGSSSNPLDDDVFEGGMAYLELTVDSNSPMQPRMEVTAVPYAQMATISEEADVATSVDGGPVDATEVAINGTTVIDTNGNWVGGTQGDSLSNLSCSAGQVVGWNGSDWACMSAAGAPSWSSIANRPAGLDDGDDDTLGSLGCSTGEIVAWNGSVWGCAADNGLTESEVEAYIVNDPIDLAVGSMVDGSVILTEASILMPDWNDVLNVPADLADGDNDTLAALSCQGGEMATWDAATSAWICGSGGSTQGAFATDNVIGQTDGGEAYDSQDTPMVIPDDNTVGITSTRFISDSHTITTISLDLQVAHVDMGEVTVTLTSPAGTTITIYNGEDAGVANINENIGWDRTFSSGNLYSFYGEDSAGVWLLNVTDNSANTTQTGNLEGWTLRLNEDWDGTLFIGDSLTVQESAEVRGELHLNHGAALVFSDTAGNETFRLSSENGATTTPGVNFYAQFYWAVASSSTNNTYTYVDVTAHCDSGDSAAGGSCDSDWTPYGWQYNETYQDNHRCRRESSNNVSSSAPFTVTSRVLCIDVTQ